MRRNLRRGWGQIVDAARFIRLVAVDALGGFLRNDGFRQASSLAFDAMLALLPALLLITHILAAGLGSSPAALQKVTAMVQEVLPAFGDILLREVDALAHQGRGVGLLNVAVLLWAVTPLVTHTRSIIACMFRVSPTRSLWLSKALDLLTALGFILGVALTSGLGFLVDHGGFLRGWMTSPGGQTLLSMALATGLVLLMVAVFSPRVSLGYLLTGALTTTALWFLLRPAFAGVLTYHHGYGMAFGSFKSLFLIVIWIYYCQAAFLFGAEVVAALHRHESVLIKRIMEGREGLPLRGRSRLVARFPAGTQLFQDGDEGHDMFHVLEGSISIRKGTHELARLGPGDFFGEMSFLLAQPRSATAVVLEDAECLVIHEENLDALMREFPSIPEAMLRELARRLRETSGHANG